MKTRNLNLAVINKDAIWKEFGLFKLKILCTYLYTRNVGNDLRKDLRRFDTTTAARNIHPNLTKNLFNVNDVKIFPHFQLLSTKYTSLEIYCVQSRNTLNCKYSQFSKQLRVLQFFPSDT